MSADAPLSRPRDVCGELLAALDASEGRRKRRKRDTTPDAIGLEVKRELLEHAIAADPEPEAFEAWLLEQCLASGAAEGGVRAMALSIFEECVWRTTPHRFGNGSPEAHRPTTGQKPRRVGMTERRSVCGSGDE